MTPLKTDLEVGSRTVIVVAIGRFVIVSPILQIAGVLLLPPVVQLQVELTRASGVLLFVPVLASLGVIALARLHSSAARRARAPHRTASTDSA